MRERFWERFPLEALTADEWEALCDGCGRCCLVRLEDEDTGEVHATRLACRLLDTDTCRCTDYAQRLARVPGCVQVTPEVAGWDWLPRTCAYRRLARGEALAAWHPLISGDPGSVQRAGVSMRGRVISETGVDEEDYQDHIVQWRD
ncbi:YcgN family cysteine cluster protein [Isoalcanivorax indicus]|uniref:YcgN family cysteine cluster protein n=1 Tax=Isoalcanivorax indicus TaxID=2202653 RepID=UPI000DBA1F73|nr:YcgN family cysteine cluster protein [Isoalcanivorax indicus]